MLSWAKQHRAPIGIDVHVTNGKSIAVAESFSTERISEESLQRILNEYFIKEAGVPPADAESSARSVGAPRRANLPEEERAHARDDAGTSSPTFTTIARGLRRLVW